MRYNLTPFSLLSQLPSFKNVDLPLFLKNNLCDRQYSVFIYLVKYGSLFRKFYYSHERIAQENGISVSTLKRYLQVYEDLGLLHVVNRGYPLTNQYLPNKECLEQKYALLSRFKNVLCLALIFSTATANRSDELVWNKTREVIKQHSANITVISSSKRSSEMLQLTPAQTEERKTYPQWAQDRALEIYKRKADLVEIENHGRYFMGILRSEASSQRPYGKAAPRKSARFNSHKTDDENKNQPQSPKQYEPSPRVAADIKRPAESEYVSATTIEKGYHDNQNMFIKMIADASLRKLSVEEQISVMAQVHTAECGCRKDWVLERGVSR